MIRPQRLPAPSEKCMPGSIWQSRNVLYSLTVREIRVRYKQSVLGVAWALFLPLAMMATFTLVFVRLLKVTSGFGLSEPYAIFAYVGLLPWSFFAQSLNQATNSLVANAGLVTKIYFPREVFPLSTILSGFFDFVLASIVLVGLIVAYDLLTAWEFTLRLTILWLPVIVAVQFMFMCGLAFLFSLSNLFYRDVKYIVTVLLQIWMFLTNVVYPLQTEDRVLSLIINANPMTPIIRAYRGALLYGTSPDPLTFTGAALASLLVFVLGWRLFRAAEPKFAECI